MNELIGKGLFVFSDPGGAKPILALVESLKTRLDDYKIISDRDYTFYQSFSITVEKPVQSPREIIQQYQPDFVFTGTSYTSKIELQFIQEANSAHIPTLAFIDHWTFMRERFNNEGTYVWPNTIFVIDDDAKQIAINDGIDPAKLQILANPYHAYLRNWKPVIVKQDFFKTLGLGDVHKQVVLFAPDPLSNINGISVFGFDEITATRELNEVIENTFADFQFIVNLHPNQNVEAIREVITPKAIIAPADVDVNALIFYSDKVIGFFSNFLIEASVMGKPVIRYHSKKGFKDPMEGKKIGEIANPETMIDKLYKR